MIFPLTSKKPVLLVGNGARSADAFEAINAFATKTEIPVLTTMNSVDLVQGENHIGFIGTYGNRVANMIIAECDLLISVGARLGLRQIGNSPEKFAPNAILIRADIDQNELGRTVKPDEEKHLTDAKAFMEALLAEEIPNYSTWKSACLIAKRALEGIDDEEGNLAIKKIASLLPDNPIVAVDVGQNQCWTAQSLSLKGKNGRILIGGGYGSMGCGLPYAIGASISRDSDKVFCITGDGGLQMNIQELETVVREKLPIKIFVLNNHALGKISEVQKKSYGERYAQTTEESGYTVPDFKRVSDAYGIKARRLSSYEQLDECAAWLLDSEPCLIDITLSTDTLLIPKLDFNTMEVKPKLSSEKAEYVRTILQRPL